jgi:signal transduction histidine kinase
VWARHRTPGLSVNRAKDDFLAVLSHELRTPLATIITGLRVLRQLGGPDERARHTRESIERQANHLSRMVDDLLDMKKIMTGVVVLERRPCDLADVVAGFLATFNEAGRFKQHTLSVDAPEPVWVNGDAMRLQQIVSNLLSNAVRYTPAGGSIHVSVKREGGDAVLHVRDTGIGIRPDLAPRMFELFVQGDPAMRSGLGVGLAIVRRLVETHSGMVEASSDGPRKGSTFTVRLPRVPAPSG